MRDLNNRVGVVGPVVIAQFGVVWGIYLIFLLVGLSLKPDRGLKLSRFREQGIVAYYGARKGRAPPFDE
jgi:hypothetical protein